MPHLIMGKLFLHLHVRYHSRKLSCVEIPPTYIIWLYIDIMNQLYMKPWGFNMVNYSISNDFDTVYFNESSNHTETFHIFENFISIRNDSSQFILIQPNAAMIAFYATFFLIIETLGNFLLYCMIIYKKYGMDPQKKNCN